MGEIKKEIIEKAAFVFNSHKADVRIDTISKFPSQPSAYELKINAEENSPIKFAYQYGEGLVAIDRVDTKRTSNILGEFLKINDLDKYCQFFQEYGFLLNIPFDKFIKIEPTQIVAISKRLQCTVDLINEINNIDPDYRRMIELALFLFYDTGWQIQIEETITQSPKYELANLIETDAFDSIMETVNEQEGINKGYYTIEDTLFGVYKLDANEYSNIVNGYHEKASYDNWFFKAITYLYANYKTTDYKTREIIDLLFHYYHEVGIPLSIDNKGIKYYERLKEKRIDNTFVDAIESFAKFIVKHEIDSNIANIHPVYNEMEMCPDWEVDSLLSAMYFSLFYLDSKNEMMRKCAYCDRYFVVKRSTTTKLYCDKYCRNNAQQAKHRRKLKANRKQQKH